MFKQSLLGSLVLGALFLAGCNRGSRSVVGEWTTKAYGNEMWLKFEDSDQVTSGGGLDAFIGKGTYHFDRHDRRVEATIKPTRLNGPTLNYEGQMTDDDTLVLKDIRHDVGRNSPQSVQFSRKQKQTPNL